MVNPNLSQQPWIFLRLFCYNEDSDTNCSFSKKYFSLTSIFLLSFRI